MNTHYTEVLGHRLLKCIKEGGKIIFFGNGGFGSISDHMATEFMGRYVNNRPPLPALSLCSNSSLLTCIGNDFGFEKIFARQIEGLAKPCDVAIGLTTSGKSKNILEAFYSCQRIGCESWAITQEDVNPSLQALCNNIIAIPSKETAEVQDLTMQLLHKVCAFIEKNCSSDKKCSSFRKALEYAYNGYADTLILDRDGVVNHLLPNDYVLDDSSLKLSGEFLEVAEDLAKAFKKIFIVTNQKCVGKGLISLDALNSIHTQMLDEIKKVGGRIDDCFSATSKDLSSSEYKPKTGLSSALHEKYPDIDFLKTIVIGDSFSDYLFAENIGSTFIYCPSL